jgi:hypothetical protein
MVQVLVALAPKFILTEVLNTVAVSPIANPVAIATDIWKSGTMFSLSLIIWAMAHIPNSNIKTLIQVWD